MRWKLLILTLLITASLTALVIIAVSNLLELGGIYQTPRTAILIAIPAATSMIASIFIYRHTAKRRRLQAFFTAFLSFTLTFAILIAILESFSRIIKT